MSVHGHFADLVSGYFFGHHGRGQGHEMNPHGLCTLDWGQRVLRLHRVTDSSAVSNRPLTCLIENTATAMDTANTWLERTYIPACAGTLSRLKYVRAFVRSTYLCRIAAWRLSQRNLFGVARVDHEHPRSILPGIFHNLRHLQGRRIRFRRAWETNVGRFARKIRVPVHDEGFGRRRRDLWFRLKLFQT